MAQYVGFIHSGSKQNFLAPLAALKAELPAGVELVEIWGDDDTGMLAEGVTELVRRPDIVAVVAAGGPDPALRLRDETKAHGSNKPIVFTTVADPVAGKLVMSLQKPGTNLTGMAGKTSELDAPRLEILHALLGEPVNVKYGVLRFENRDRSKEQYEAVVDKAGALKVGLVPMRVSTMFGVKRAFEHFKRQGVAGVVVTADSFFNNHRAEVAAIARETQLPAIYQWKEFVSDGGLMSYGPDILEAYKMAGQYVARIVQQSVAPGDIPCSEPSAFQLHINGSMAKQLGITPPATLKGKTVQLI